MKKLSFILVSIFTANFLNSETIELKEGWNLIGVSNTTTIKELKDKNSSIKEIFIYKNNFINTGIVNPTDGLWVYSNRDLNLTLKENTLNETINERVDKITLNSGWNLISLPIDSAISPKIFKNISTIWRYSDGKWKQYGKNENSEYPKIDIIGNGEGFWVNSKEIQTIYLSDEEAKLTNFDTKTQMDEYLSAMVHYNKSYRTSQELESYYPTTYWEGVGIHVDLSASPKNQSVVMSVNDATTTNIQELGIDEADIVKHDGEKIFYLPSLESSEIYINRFDRILAGKIEKLTSIKLDTKIEQLYLINNKLIVIYKNDKDFRDSLEAIESGNVWNENSKFEVFDVSNLNNIKKIAGYKFDGNIIDTRVVNNRLYLITKFIPFIEVEYPKNYVECIQYMSYGGGSLPDYNSNSTYTSEHTTILTPIGIDGSIGEKITITTTNSGNGNIVSIVKNSNGEVIETNNKMYYGTKDENNYCWFYKRDDTAYFKFDYENPIFKSSHLKPTITNIETNISKEIFTPQSLYTSNKFDKSNFITSITSFDINDFSNQESISTTEDSSSMYATNKSIYITSQDYPIYFGWRNYQERTSIYKFSIDTNLTYIGKVFIDGKVPNQFSLSEYNDILRVASTTGWSFRNDTNNTITTIGEIDGKLNIFGKLEGLGKEGETIKGVRFLGDRGFVVTFKQSDPLYTIDLSDPTNPKKVGELNIDGYSTYFHLIDENKILSIGRDTETNGLIKGFQIELFDISDFSNPTLADKVTIDTNGLFSEAEKEHKAFTYRNSDNLFSIPMKRLIEREMTENEKSEYLNQYYLENKDKIEFYEKEGMDINITPSYYPLIHEYNNYLNIYKIDGLNINYIDKIDGDNLTLEYGYQRSIIFTKDSIDYGLYVAGGKLFIKEITK